jgi:hypothetical protein
MKKNVLLPALIVLLALAVAACGSPKISNGPSASTAPSSAPATAPAAASTTPQAPAAEPAGSGFTVSGTNPDSTAYTYRVALVRVIQDAAPDNSFDAAPSGQHLAGAEFRVTGVTGDSSDDANLDAVAVGGNGQLYSPSFDGLAAGTDFDSGDWNVQPGATETGWVAFTVPNGVSITSIQWAPPGTTSPATWNLGS